MGIPKVRLGKWIVSRMRETTTPNGGNRNGTLTNCPMVGMNKKHSMGGVEGEEGVDYS